MRQLVAQALQHRNQTPQFLGRGDARRIRARGFRAYVDDVGALFLHMHGVREGAIRIQVFAAIGERIGRDVQHAHDQRALAELQLAAFDFPEVRFARHSDP